MTHVPHELADDFPNAADKIASLKQSDAHFAGLCDRYHEINRAIHRAETNVAPTDDLHMSEMRRERMTLKDTIARYLA